jgi:alkylhydroperoxidase family enzyme
MNAGNQQGARIGMLSREEAQRLGKEVGIPSTLAPLTVFRTLLRRPDLAVAVATQLSLLLWKSNRLDLRLREFIIMRIGWRQGADYEWSQHFAVALHIGMTEADIVKVRDWRNAEGLSAAEQAVLAATDDTLDLGGISDETWAQCREHVGGDEILIEMTLAIANWRSFSELLLSLKIPMEDGLESWPPDGRAGPG